LPQKLPPTQTFFDGFIGPLRFLHFCTSMAELPKTLL
jgi:hypothetical protein